MENFSIKDIISSIEVDLKQGNTNPATLNELLIKSVGWYSHLVVRIAGLEADYNAELYNCYQEEEKANRAKIKAKNSEVYKKLNLAKAESKALSEIIMSIKKVLSSTLEEFKHN